MPFFRNRLKYVTTRYWDCSQAPVFPEKTKLGEKAKLGICFSGGGTRSTSCTHGQLRALDALGLLDNTGYISCVSGGSWAALPFTFLNRHYEDRHFLGTIVDPRELTEELLDDVHSSNYLATVTQAGIVDDIIEQAVKLAGDETYSRAVGDVFLAQFGLNDRAKVFAHDRAHLDDVLAQNPNLNSDDFYHVEKDRPFLVVGGALLRKGDGDLVFEMTPMYTGISKLYKGLGAGGRDIGGGFIESFAMDSDEPDKINRDGTLTVRLGNKGHRFALSDVVGTSGAAPAEVLNNLLIRQVGFPDFRHWPLTKLGKTSSKTYEFGDGGNIENLGILPLLKRGVEKIVVFVNTKKPLERAGSKIRTNKAIELLFRSGSVNQVFAEDELEPLKDALMSRAEVGDAAVVSKSYTTVANAHHGIEAGHDVQVLWVYNNLYQSWCDHLPAAIREQIGKRGKLKNFPHFATFLENPPKLIDLAPIQANLLSQMSSAVVMDNKALFDAHLN